MEFNENSVKIFNDKLFVFLNSTLPGIFTLEFFFKNGLFSKAPKTLYDFILLIFWAFILSIPFNLIHAFSFRSYFVKLKNRSLRNKKITEEQQKLISGEVDDYIKKNEEDLKKKDETLHFIFLLVYLLSIFFIYKYLITKYEYYSVWKINPKILIYLNALIIFYILVFPIIYFLTRKIEKRILKNELKKINVN